jgi:pre-60S factor REI1
MDSLGTSATHPYTCLSCSLAFTDATFQRDHYATDLHRYNSKRRVAGLTPVSIELFEEKIMDRKEPEVEESGRLSCKACK